MQEHTRMLCACAPVGFISRDRQTMARRRHTTEPRAASDSDMESADSARTRDAATAAADWEQTFNAVSDPMALLTLDYRVVRTNAAYVGWMHTTRGRCEGHECFVLGERHEGPCTQCPLPQTVETGRPGFVRQVRMQPEGPAGALIPHIYESWTYPVFGESGRVERVVEIIKDVTERERLQQVMSEAQALREADQLKSELLGTVSHELRSPLASIKGYAATLLKHERRLSTAERHEFLQSIVEASDRLESVIDRVLEMSQLETGSMRLDSSPVDIERLARETVRAAELSAVRAHPDQFTFIVESQFAPGRRDAATSQDAADQHSDSRGMGQPVAVLGDARRLRSLLDDLLENAVKYSPSGGKIAVILRPYERAADTPERQTDGANDVAGRAPTPLVEVQVRDTGIGIPPDQLSRVFDRFHRVDTRLTRETEGLGLGLAIAKRIVELHGGSIWAENVAQGGSIFHVVLPLAPIEADEAEEGAGGC